jgi:hypothetical protein
LEAVDDAFPREHPNKGWNRASIIFWSRKPYRPNIKAEDVALPRGAGQLRTLGTCAAMGTLLTVICLWFPLFVAGLYVPLDGPLYAAIVGGAALALTAFTYVLSIRREREAAKL